jgi:uncharacterized protein (DUF697 family)
MSSTSTTSLAPRDVLAENRGTIVLRSIAAGVLGLVPIPILDDWLVAAIKRSAVRRIADSRQVDLTDDAIRAVAEGDEPSPTLNALAQIGTVKLIARRGLRKLVLVFAVLRRADAMAQTFAVLTLFDHYCARLHVGVGLDESAATRLRAAIDEARQRTRGRLAAHLFRRGLFVAARVAVRAPLELLDVATRGALGRLLGRKDEAEAEELLDEAVSHAASRPTSFLRRAARAVEDELAGAGRVWIDEMIGRLEAQLRPGPQE